MKSKFWITAWVGILASAAAWAAPAQVRVTVKGMVCAFCAQGITKKFSAEPSVSDVQVSLGKHLVTLALKDGQSISDEKVTTILKDAGYTVEKIERP